MKISQTYYFVGFYAVLIGAAFYFITNYDLQQGIALSGDSSLMVSAGLFAVVLSYVGYGFLGHKLDFVDY